MTLEERAEAVALQLRNNTSWDQSTEQILVAAFRAVLEDAANISTLDPSSADAIRAVARRKT